VAGASSHIRTEPTIPTDLIIDQVALLTLRTKSQDSKNPGALTGNADGNVEKSSVHKLNVEHSTGSSGDSWDQFAHYDSCLQLGLIALLLLAIISMASSTATKKLKIKDGSKRKRFLDSFKGLKSGNASASQPNSTRVSISSASIDHDPGQGNDAGNAEPAASGKYSSAILELSTTIQPFSSCKWYLASGYVLSWFPTRRSNILNPPSRPCHPIPFSYIIERYRYDGFRCGSR